MKYYAHTDSGNAELFASAYSKELRYAVKQGRWLSWNPERRRWEERYEGSLYQLVKDAVRVQYKRAEKDDFEPGIKWYRLSENLPRIKATLELAKYHSPISDLSDKWNTDPWLLGVDNGIVDLRTGKLRKGTPKDLITKFSPVAFDPDAECLRFEHFLWEIFGGDNELVGYMRRVVGYCLTGLTQEQCLFLLYGGGSNGKSTLMGVLHYVLGDYAENLPSNTFDALIRSALSPELEKLCGCRFATAIETTEGMKLNESRIKSLTGGDPITARPLWRPPVTFPPTHKLCLAFNNRPIIPDNSFGMWRRVHLIPFLQTFVDGQRDEELPNTLRGEAAGILRWGVEGSLEWQRKGLRPPAAVVNATADYRVESDHVGQFLEECCVLGKTFSVLASDLWARYQAWIEETKEKPLPRSVFAERLKRHGLTSMETGHHNVRTWMGIKLNGEKPEGASLRVACVQ